MRRMGCNTAAHVHLHADYILGEMGDACVLQLYRVHMHQLPSIVRDPKWDSARTGTIKIATDSGGVTMDGVFNVTTNWANITWVATDTSYSTLLVHVRNGYSSKNLIYLCLSNNCCIEIIGCSSFSALLQSLVQCQ